MRAPAKRSGTAGMPEVTAVCRRLLRVRAAELLPGGTGERCPAPEAPARRGSGKVCTVRDKCKNRSCCQEMAYVVLSRDSPSASKPQPASPAERWT